MRHWALHEGTHLLGRDPHCDIVVPDPSVSRKHMRLVHTGDHLDLEDLQSSNGLWVDGVRVDKVRISPGEWFSTGSVLFNVRRSVTFTSLDLTGSGRESPASRVAPASPRAGEAVEGKPAGKRKPTRSSEPVTRGTDDLRGILDTPASALTNGKGNEQPPSMDGRDDPSATASTGAGVAPSSPSSSDSRTYRDLLHQMVLRQPSPDGSTGALLGAVVALAGAKGGAVLLRSSVEWFLYLSRGEQLPNWEELPPGLCAAAAQDTGAATVIRAGAMPVVCAPVVSGGDTVGIILVYPATHAGPILGLDLVVDAVRQEWLAPHYSPNRSDGAVDPRSGAPSPPFAGARVISPFAVPASGFLTASDAGRRLLDEVDRLAVTDLPVMLIGESGTGKELLAHRLHRRSRRAAGPFVALNCSSFPRDLVEAELFGIDKGVATGVLERTGRFQQASGGTLLLDEIGDLPLALQPKLLRALENREVLPIGAPQPAKVDVRVVSATHLDLKQAVGDKLFRQDLLYRLAGAEIHTPPLRARPEDILPLARHFAREAASAQGMMFLGMDIEAASLLLGYAWPGNVRELQHVIARAVALSDGPILQESLLPPEIRRESDRALGDALLCLREDWRTASDAYARLYFTHLLTRCNGNLSEAARRAGIGRTTLYSRLQELGLRDLKDKDANEEIPPREPTA